MSEPPDTDPFAVLGLPRRYDLALDELERRFHERSRSVHPDRFARATPAERRGALERTTRLNEAYRTLRDPWRRAACLLALLVAGVDHAVAPDPVFLEEQLSAREELATARRRRDRRALEELRGRAVQACGALEEEVARALRTELPDASALGAARRALARAGYHRALIEEADRALDVAWTPGPKP